MVKSVIPGYRCRSRAEPTGNGTNTDLRLVPASNTSITGTDEQENHRLRDSGTLSNIQSRPPSWFSGSVASRLANVAVTSNQGQTPNFYSPMKADVSFSLPTLLLPSSSPPRSLGINCTMETIRICRLQRILVPATIKDSIYKVKTTVRIR